MPNRRSLIAGIAAALAAGAARAQGPGRRVRIGRLSPQSPEADAPIRAAFEAGLRERGWIEGRNLWARTLFAYGRTEPLAAQAHELIADKVDLIVAGSSPGALAAKRATSSIPIVFATTGDPIRDGIVANIARPGGNITGVTALGPELAIKRLEVLKDTFPRLRRVGVLGARDGVHTRYFRSDGVAAAAGLGMVARLFEVDDAAELPAAFAAMRDADSEAMLLLTDIMFISHRERVVELAARLRLPAMYWDRVFLQSGGLMYYGASLPALYRHVAAFVDKILRGAAPGDLPVEQPSRLELVVNLKAAKAQGIAIPEPILLRADEVME